MIILVLKHILCLGILYALYFIFLKREKRFIFNRCYLLLSILISLTIPFITFQIDSFSIPFEEIHVQLTDGGVENDKAVKKKVGSEFIIKRNHGHISLNAILLSAHIIISGIFVSRFLLNIFQLIRSIKTNEKIHTPSHTFVLLNKSTSPYSFFKFLFIHKNQYTKEGIPTYILRHELAHIRSWHSLDVVLMELLLSVLWINPFYWFTKSSIKANHEYFADSRALGNTPDIKSYCQQLLQVATQTSQPKIACNFHFTETKNRIIMLYQSKTPLLAYAGKLLSITLIASVAFMGFTFTNPTQEEKPLSPKETQVFRVLIDASHGGNDPGAASPHFPVFEKDITLGIIQSLDKLSIPDGVEIIFTRTSDEFLSLAERAKMAKSLQVDLFLSIHINSADNPSKDGIEVFFVENTPYSAVSKSYGEIFSENLKWNDSMSGQTGTANYYLLRELPCPALTLQVGYLSNKQTAAYLSSDEGKSHIAHQLLASIVQIKP
jgi:N-acetylmuramoyl-L-alanine amidase